jgi:hypothetical protein
MRSTMRKTSPRLFGRALLFTIAAAAGCSDAEPAASPVNPPTEREVQALGAPEAGAAATEYQSRLVTLRLFGTQGTSDGDAATATFADTANFATQSYRVGETLGRNLQVAAIHEDRVEVVDVTSGARRTILAGQDVNARLIDHDFDRAARDEGQHQWTVKGRVMARLAGRYGLGATTTAMEQPFAGYRGRRLGAVDRRGVFGRLGLKDGDLVLAIDGQAATESALLGIPARFVEAKSQVLLLTVARGGNIWEAAYVIE